MRSNIEIIKGSGDACFHCGAPNPRPMLDRYIKFWTCSQDCIKEYYRDLMEGEPFGKHTVTER